MRVRHDILKKVVRFWTAFFAFRKGSLKSVLIYASFKETSRKFARIKKMEGQVIRLSAIPSDKKQ